MISQGFILIHYTQLADGLQMKKVFFLCFLFSSLLLHAGRPVLKVHKGNFKIVQFTDVHWSVGGKYEVKNDSTLLVMNAVLDAEKPDLVVFTGDVVVSKDALEGWERVLAPVELRKIPFAVTFGNHDTEADVPTTDVLAFIAKRPYNVTTNAGGGVEGVGNCVLPVRNEKGDATAWNLFLFDSHAYTNDSTLGYYDWIKKSQVDWFVAESNRSAAKNKTYRLWLSSIFLFRNMSMCACRRIRWEIHRRRCARRC